MLKLYLQTWHRFDLAGAACLAFLLACTQLFAQLPQSPLREGSWGPVHRDTCYTSGKYEGAHRRLTPFWQAVARQGGKMTASQETEFAAMKTATIILQFGNGFDSLDANSQPAKDAFRFAADIWETEVVSVVPIIISADFAPLGGGVLGQNSSPSVTGVPNAPDPTVNYTLALANAIAGFDLSPGTPNGNQTYNINFSFYFGLDGSTPAGQTDFVTVVLHEIGHSMGISGISNGGAGVGANNGQNPRSWDLLVELGDGTPILDLGFGTPEQVAALISNDLFINGPLAVAALGGQRPKIFAPDPFNPGSSYSHWDEATFPAGDPNSLMTPFLGSGESNFDIGDITRGVLVDQGWLLPSDLEAQDVGVVAVASPVSDSDLGAAEMVEVIVRNFGIEPAENFEVSYRIDGGAVVTETFVGPIPAVSVTSFTFTAPADFSADGTSFSIQAFTNLTGDQDPSNDAITVEISNLVPSVDVPVMALDFGPVGLGNEETLTLSVINDATGPFAGEVDIQNISFPPAGDFTSADVGALPITLLPGESFDLTFVYTPSSFGANAGTAAIQTNAGSDIEISLTGEGVEPPVIGVTPDALLTELQVGETDTQLLTITNTGVADLDFSLSFNSDLPPMASVAAPFNGGEQLLSSKGASLWQKSRKKISLKSFSSTTQSVNAENAAYRVDDGTSESNIGLGSLNELMWLNAFRTVTGAEVITSISSAVASGLPETPARFILYEDPDDDGDPKNAVFLTESSGILTNPGEDIFTTVNIEPTEVKGVFFVAVLITEVPGINSFPMPQDSDSPSQKSSWAVSNAGVGGFDVNDLSKNSLPPLLIDNAGANGLPGNWLLRADGQFFSVKPTSGTLAQGESTQIEVNFIATFPGSYTSSIQVSNNDPNNREVNIPVNMEVEPVPVAVSPTTLNVSLPQGAVSREVITLTNTGDSDATYSISVSDTENVTSPLSVQSLQQARVPFVKRGEPVISSLGKDDDPSAIMLEGASTQTGIVQYETGFENFSLGDINGQDGWTVQKGNWTVESLNPAEGVRHFRGLADGGQRSLAFSPYVGIGTDPISSLSLDIALGGTGVTWQIVPQSISTFSVNTRLQFNADGSIAALVNDPVNGSTFVPLAVPVPEGYFNLRIEVIRATSKFTIYFDNEVVFQGVGFAGDIEQLVIISFMEAAGPTLDMDNLRIFDGSSQPTTPIVTPQPMAGVVPAGGSVDVEVLFDADRDFGTYRSNLIIALNDNPIVPPLVVEATLQVTGPPDIAIHPTVIEEAVDFNKTSTRTIRLTNTGGEPVTYDLRIIGVDVENMTAREVNNLLTAQKEERSFDSRVAEKLARDKQWGHSNTAEPHPFDVIVGETFFEEGFESATFPPEGWQVIDNEGTGMVWKFAAHYEEGNYSGTGEAATASSDLFGVAEFDTELWTPAIDISGKENISLEYNVNYQNFNGLDFLDLGISTDNGATWTTLLSWNENHGAFRNQPAEKVSIMLDPYIEGATEIILRWHYYDPNTNDFNWYAQVDDVALKENAQPWLSVSPVSGTIPVGQTAEVEALFNAASVDPGFYVAGIVVNSNAATTPQVGILVTMTALEPAGIALSPTTIEQDIVQFRTASQTLTLQNTGISALDFRFEDNFKNVGGPANNVAASGSPLALGDLQYDPLANGYFNPTFIGQPDNYQNAVSFSTPVYATNFEALTLGDVNGQDGWISRFSGWEVSNLNPFGRMQHLRGLSNGSGENTVALSPNIGIGTEEFSSVSAVVSLSELGSGWSLIPQSRTAGFIVTELRFNPDGSIIAAVTDNGGEFQLVETPIPSGYFEIEIEVERATADFTIYFDELAVFSGNGFTGNIEQLVLVGFNQTTGSIFDVDNVQIVDGVVPEAPVSPSPIAGVVPSGQSSEVSINFDATNLEPGTYEETLVIFSNDPENPRLEIPVALNVIGAQVIGVSPDALTAFVEVGQQTKQSIAIENSGEADLDFELSFQGGIILAEGMVSQNSLRTILPAKDWENDFRILQKMQKDIEHTTEVTEHNSVPGAGTIALLVEDFDGGTFPPDGWNVIDNTGTGLVWAFASDYEEGNYSGTGEAATASSDAFGSQEFDTELWTPPIAVEGRENLPLEYLVNYQNFAAYDFLDVDISTDGGSTWVNMLRWNEDHGGFFNLPGELVSIKLDSFIDGAESFIIRWRYYNPSLLGEELWYAQIDNVVIGVPWIETSLVKGTVASGAQTNVDIQLDASILPEGQYQATLVVNSNDLLNPEVKVPVNLLVVENILQVTSFVLVDAANDVELREMTDGDVINLFALDNDNINIKANTLTESVGSVLFELTGPTNRTHIENVPPYALFSDREGNYRNWKPRLGTYSLTATPYSLSRGRGEAGISLTIQFEVIDQNDAMIVFALIDPVSDTELGPLNDGMVIYLDDLGLDFINIEAKTTPEEVGSIAFVLNGAESREHIENVVPYALFSDRNADYRNWDPAPGNYSLSATAYSRSLARGSASEPFTINFSVEAGASEPEETEKDPSVTVNAERTDIQVFPNPFDGNIQLRFPESRNGNISIRIFTAQGTVMFEKSDLLNNTDEVGFIIDRTIPPGMYYIRVETENGTSISQIMKQ